MKADVASLQRRIRAGRGDVPADLVLKRARVVNVFTGDILVADVAVQDGYVAGVQTGYEGKQEVDADGRWVAPGLIDPHIHIESSMLMPSRLAAALAPHGTSAIVSDPHEIANVLGMPGIRFLLERSEHLPVDVFFTAPSCVPSTPLETSGARLDADALLPLLKEPRVLGLAEMMNFPGVCHGDAEVLEKLIRFQDRILDGHSPGLKGYDLQAYLAAGIQSDHECTTPEEAREKVAAGMFVMIREGTSARNLDALLPAVTTENAGRFCFASDDLHPQDLLRRGHLNHLVQRAIRAGLHPALAVRLASFNPASYFGLRDRGAVAPGFRADLVVLDDLDMFLVNRVYKDGKLVAEDGNVCASLEPEEGSVKAKPLATGSLTPDRFRIQARDAEARAMELVPGQILTRQVLVHPRVRKGEVVSDPEQDLLKIAVVERHQGSGRTGLGLVRGFGLGGGALAGSVAHDSHNVIAVGVEDTDLVRAVEEVREMGGGLAVTRDGNVLARVPLPVAGLLSDAPIRVLVDEIDEANRAAASLGCRLEDPFMLLSFLALPVIPALKLTDRGLVDVERFEHVPLFVPSV
jgi:adenine deaminase